MSPSYSVYMSHPDLWRWATKQRTNVEGLVIDCIDAECFAGKIASIAFAVVFEIEKIPFLRRPKFEFRKIGSCF